jgi:serine/threonine-protein kinase RsbW
VDLRELRPGHRPAAQALRRLRDLPLLSRCAAPPDAARSDRTREREEAAMVTGDPRGGVPHDELARQLDGAVADWTVSGDAMRWSPERAEQPDEPAPPSAFPGVDVAAGLGSVLGLDPATVRRLVSAAVSSMGMVAGDMVEEVRGWGARLGRRHPS